MHRLWNWLDDRTGYRHFVHETLYERVPGGARWRYVWGSTLVFTFMVQVITGLFLWTAYSPSVQSAWESVYYIQEVMTLGWVVRGIHHYAAQAMIVLMVLHVMQVVIDGAYRAPREVNFWLGLVLMQIVLGLSLTGYLLPWDQKGYYATKVATNIAGSTPFVGHTIQQLAQGGPAYGHHTLTRFFALHAGILPALLILFLVMHVYVFRRHGIKVRKLDRAPETTFWPDQVLRDAIACLAVLAAVLALTVFKGAELSAPANPAEDYKAARPEWYFLFLFRFLKFESIAQYGEAVGGIYIPGALMLILAAMPLIAYLRGGHKFNVAFLWIVFFGAAGLTGVAWYEDNMKDSPAGRDFRSAVAAAHQDADRVRLLAEVEGIPSTGALDLLRNDPLTQGPRIFANRCADCHRWNGHNGLGKPVMITSEGLEELVESPASAPDLGNFGSREWVRSIVTDFAGHMESLANLTDPTRHGLGEAIRSGDMANWSADDGVQLLDPANLASADALIEFLVAQSDRDDLGPFQPELVTHGRSVFETGELAAGAFTSTCGECHTMRVAGEEEPLSEDGYGPILTGYGGQAWLRDFINDPQSHYGDNNAMPGFDGQLTPRQIELLVRWMTHDYHAPQPADSEQSGR